MMFHYIDYAGTVVRTRNRQLPTERGDRDGSVQRKTNECEHERQNM